MIKMYDYSLDYVNMYIDEIGGEVITEVDKNRGFWKAVFPESFNGKKLNSAFFYDILSLKIDDLCKKYDSINSYYQFAFFSSINIKKVHLGEKKQSDRNANRKKYVDLLLSNNYFRKNIVNYIPLIKPAYYNDSSFKNLQTVVENRLKRINFGIRKVFNYNKFIKRKQRIEILDDLKIKVCPYCNRQYVTKLDIDMGKIIGDIDHFYSQNYFTLFALSLYNFVPSCKICNSLFKSDINADIQYPYRMKCDSNVTFELVDKNGKVTPASLYGWEEKLRIKIIPKSADRKKANREIEFFKLNAQYELHNEYAKSILYKKIFTNNSLLTQLESLFLHNKINMTQGDIKKVVYGFDVDNIDIRESPLALLTKDLYEKY